MANIAASIIVAADNNIYSVDVVTGKALVLTTVPNSVGGVNVSGIAANMLAVNARAGLIYYTQGANDSDNRQLFAYDYVNNTHILIDADLTNNGAGRSITLGNGGLSGGAAAFRDGALYLGVDSVSGSSDRIYKLTMNADGRGVASAAQLGPQITQSSHDWGDIAIDPENNVILSFTRALGLQRYDLETGALIDRPVSSFTALGVEDGIQGATDRDGNAYVVGFDRSDRATLVKFDPATGDELATPVLIRINGSPTDIDLPNDAALLPDEATGTVAGALFFDTDADGIRDPGEVAARGISVLLYDDVNNNGSVDAQDRLLDSVRTNVDGDYIFTGVMPANLLVKVDRPDGAKAGADMLRLAQSLTGVDLAVVNIPPANIIRGPFSLSEDPQTEVAIGGIAIDDIDENVRSASLSVLHGNLSVTLSGAATISSGANGTSDFEISGTQADIASTLSTLRYKPSDNFNGLDTLSVISEDAAGERDTDTAVIDVTSVNDAPTAAALNAVHTGEDLVSASVAIGALDIDDDTLSYSLKAGAEPSKGSVAFSGDRFTYTPIANATGTDSFTIVVSDGNGGQIEQAVSVSITAVNDAPAVAARLNVRASEDQALRGVAIGAFDVEGDALTYRVKAGAEPTKGTVAFSGGQFTYTPKANATGTDSFMIVVSDGNGGSSEQAVSVSIAPVDDAPTAVGFVPRLASRAENALTGARIKVADISVTDIDGGAKKFALTGPDAAYFEIVRDEVYLKANTVLDYEAKTSLRFAVSVDGGTASGFDAVSSMYTLNISNVSGRYVGTASANTLNGSQEEDAIAGLAGDDQLSGGGGNDTMNGGAGRDVMTGGAGRDTFVFTSPNDSLGPVGVLVNNSTIVATGKDQRDLITDFTHGTDKIDLSAMDASSKLAGNQAFAFVGNNGFSKKAGELHVVKTDLPGTGKDMTLVEGDINGDGAADFQIQLKGLVSLTIVDFVL